MPSLSTYAHSIGRRLVVFISVCLLGVSGLNAQITVSPNQTALDLAQKLTGAGVAISNATLSCPTSANGMFVATNSNLGLDSGIVLATGYASTNGTTQIGVNGAPSLFASHGYGAAGDADLTTISGQTTHDACKLEFDFVPAGDTIKFSYVFGSDEYTTFNCSINDVFAFFISGPGITGSPNIALVPGTTIPVAISTINNGSGYTATPSNPCYANTNGNGPYTQYYVTNTGTTVTYNGFTTVLQAIKAVTPCQTYHLKLAIADASDDIYDSGVFLKAGSLTSNAIAVTPLGGGGLSSPKPYCVRNCTPGQFQFNRPVALTTPLTIHYIIAGSAVNGVDYTFIPDSVVIPAGQTTVFRNIQALAPPFGYDSVQLKIYSPYSCNNNPVLIDSATLYIQDSVYANILNPDTTICLGKSVNLKAETFPGAGVTYSWSPATGLSCTNCTNPTATPTSTTIYTLTTNVTGSGCTPGHDQVKITVQQPAQINAGPDRTTCVGTPFTFNTTVTPATQTYTWSWTPAAQLSSTTVQNPTFGATAIMPWTDYIVSADPGSAGCVGKDTVRLRVIEGNFTLVTQDTAICKGATIHTRVIADTVHSYLWSPTTDVNNPFIRTPDITPDTSRTYTITSSFAGCPSVSHNFKVDVQPNPVVFAGLDRAKCQWDTLQLHGLVGPDWYTKYSYMWSPGTDLSATNVPNVVFSGQTNATLTLTVTTPAGCKGTDDINIIVHQGNFASMVPTNDTNICPRDSVQIIATGGVKYQWVPAVYLTSDKIPNPVSHPITSTNYTGYVTDQYGCMDTLHLAIVVSPEAVINVPDSVTIYPGETYQLDPSGNCLYYTWFPALGLNNPNIANPVASPGVNTRYYVNAVTEWGCSVRDSIDVYVNPETALDVPNAFTPGSSPNPTIKVVRRGLATLKYFRIFNRWGQKVFESSDINEGWNGQYNGTPQPMGVYIYQVEAVTSSGRTFYKQGNITLIR